MKRASNTITYIAFPVLITLLNVIRIDAEPEFINSSNIPDSLRWIKSGEIVGKSSSEWVYVDGTGKHLYFTRSISDCAKIIRNEIKHDREYKNFIENTAIGFFYSIFAPERSQIIHSGVIAVRNELPRDVWDSYATPGNPASWNKILSKYLNEYKTIISDETWHIGIPLLMPDGSIEIWKISGNVQNFSILVFEKRVVEPPNTIAIHF